MPARIARFKVIDAGVMTGTNVITSVPTNVDGLSLVSYEADWTGTPNGTFSFEGSNSYDPQRGTGNWIALTLTSPPTNPSGAAGNWLLTLANVAYRYVRMKYTNASSTGVLNVFVQAKE